MRWERFCCRVFLYAVQHHFLTSSIPLISFFFSLFHSPSLSFLLSLKFIWRFWVLRLVFGLRHLRWWLSAQQWSDIVVVVVVVTLWLGMEFMWRPFHHNLLSHWTSSQSCISESFLFGTNSIEPTTHSHLKQTLFLYIVCKKLRKHRYFLDLE